jgi:acetolactate decarboxylase
MRPQIEVELSGSVMRALRARQGQTGESLSRIVDGLLSEALDLERHSIFQVSTSNALVKGVFDGSATVGELLSHGDFGLGTFDRLDGEMIMIDGECFRATAGGAVDRADDDREVPFALVTRFEADLDDVVESKVALTDLTRRIDALRPSQNLFAALRITGRFEELSLRAACPARPGEGLVEATAHQSEFEAREIEGTLVGFWAPEYAMAVSVPGYHFHFISEDRALGGHVLGMRGRGLAIDVHTERDVHLSLPETAEFLTADLSGEHAAALEKAETGHSG